MYDNGFYVHLWNSIVEWYLFLFSTHTRSWKVADARFLITMALNAEIQNVDSERKFVVQRSQKNDYRIPEDIFQYKLRGRRRQRFR
jgi:hypothetical protein